MRAPLNTHGRLNSSYKHVYYLFKSIKIRFSALTSLLTLYCAGTPLDPRHVAFNRLRNKLAEQEIIDSRFANRIKYRIEVRGSRLWTSRRETTKDIAIVVLQNQVFSSAMYKSIHVDSGALEEAGSPAPNDLPWSSSSTPTTAAIPSPSERRSENLFEWTARSSSRPGDGSPRRSLFGFFLARNAASTRSQQSS